MSDRDLDRRVAEALGWHRYIHGAWAPPDSAGAYQDEPHAYSTAFGPWTDEEFAWLARRGDVTIVIEQSGSVVVAELDEGHRQSLSGECRDVKEAIACLIVAADGWEREGGDA